MSKQKLLTVGALAAICIMAAFTLQAKAAGQEGMVVVRDPQTGKMRPPTPEEAQALRARTPPAAATAGPREPSVTTRRDGSRGVRLGEKNMVYEVVTRDADGKLSSQCAHGDQAAGSAVSSPAFRPAGADHKEHRHEAR